MRSICIALTLTLILCSPIAHADDQADIQNASRAATKFINDYCSTTHGSQKGVVVWLKKRPDVFPIFKERISKLYLDALKSDPELGFEGDAILGGREELGTKYRPVDSFYGREHITITLQAVAPKDCNHKVEVVMMKDDDGVWKIQTSGDIPM